MTRDDPRPLILVSNDDGVNALGNVALRRSLARIADVYTVAPEHEQSAKSHAISLHVPLRYRTVSPNVHAVDGTPADCVYVALFMESLLPRRPDLVVSGINHGANLGTDVHYSGTVAAAREAALRGIPSIAFSNLHHGNMEAMAELATSLCERMLTSLQSATRDAEGHAPLLNVNFPDRPMPRGVIATSFGQRHYAEGVDLRDDPRGRPYFWIGGAGGVHHPEMPGSDTEAVDAGFVSVAPLSLRVTDTQQLGLAAFVAGPTDDPQPDPTQETP
ncbi:MAG: 5'/3'-nucleotidase SurE [Polyangiales bacterium]|nr:5'/3'-nucleotidase SurE [Sandaracinaceae bacterium]